MTVSRFQEEQISFFDGLHPPVQIVLRLAGDDVKNLEKGMRMVFALHGSEGLRVKMIVGQEEVSRIEIDNIHMYILQRFL